MYIKIVNLFCISIFCILNFNCKKDESKLLEESKVIPIQDVLMRVTIKNGLNIRENHDINSKLIAIIPYGKWIWVRKEFSQTVTINGLVGKWVYIEAYYSIPTNKQKWVTKTGWVFNAYLGDINMKLKNGIKDFQAGCIGAGCDTCGSIVFDPDGFFARSLDCDDETISDIGRWKKIDDYIIACTNFNCNPDLSDPKIVKFSLDKSGNIIIEENGLVQVIKGSFKYWEPGGWEWVKERNHKLLPPD